MSLINDALKRAQEEKNNNAPSLPDDPGVEVISEPRPARKANRMVVVLLLGAIVAAGAWYFLYVKKGVPASAVANNLQPIATAITQPVTGKPAAKPAVPTRENAPATGNTPSNWSTSPSTSTFTPAPPTLPNGLEEVFKKSPDPAADMLNKPLNPANEPEFAFGGRAPATAPSFDNFTADPGFLKSTGADRIKLPPENSGDNANTAKPTAAKADPPVATQPAPKPEKTVADAASVAQQFHVTCIMFSDSGSTAIVNGSAVKVGQTIRSDGISKTGLPEEATVKKIERSCVEIEFNRERYLLRI